MGAAPLKRLGCSGWNKQTAPSGKEEENRVFYN
jgi:hypothetical protein